VKETLRENKEAEVKPYGALRGWFHLCQMWHAFTNTKIQKATSTRMQARDAFFAEL
jgi:hypothetical protein